MSDGLECPKCKQIDRVQKLRVLYQEGIAKSQYQTWLPPPQDTNWAPLLTTREGISQTVLSARFAPPAKPSIKKVKPPPWDKRYTLLALALFVIPIGLIVPTLLSARNDLPNEVLLILYGILAIALIMLFLGLRKRQKERERIWREDVLPRWERALSKWNSLFFCARDDGLFIPGKSDWMPADQLESFLWN